jgi:hypothetical protein
MPIRFDLEKLREKYDCKYFFETGLYHGKGSEKALTCKFDKNFCVEIIKDLVEDGRKKFKNEIENGRYTLYIVNKNFKENRTIFFLDSHVDNANIRNYKHKCPLFDELEAISCIERNDNIILIDDLRIIKNAFPWGEKSYGNIDFISKIKEKILSINSNYQFGTLDGNIENDVLIAYV